MRIVLKIAWVGVLLYVVLCVFVFFNQKSLIFFPSREAFALPWAPNLKEISIETGDGISLNAWFLDNKSDKTVLFFHGNGGNISYNQERLRILNELRLNAIIFDYRGYGKSEGEIRTEEDLYSDADAVYGYAVDKGADPKNIIIWGQSLGGAIAVNLAQNRGVYATILESTFQSMDEMTSRQYGFLPTGWILRFHFRNMEKIQNITSPVLVIHSRNDEMIPFFNGQKLFDKTKGQKLFLETRGSHNGGFQESYDLYLSTIGMFLKVTK